MKYINIIVVCFLLFNCKSPNTEQLSAEAVMDMSIDISGGDKIASSRINFDFRDIKYSANRNVGTFQLKREFIDSTSHTVSAITDVLSNNGFERYVDDMLVVIPDSTATTYSASVNSVHYFSVLPYGLNDTAVNKTLQEAITIKSNMYHTIKVTFDQDGGGEDFEDVFLYWINQETNKVDYLAYSYNEDHGKGFRFREAFNERYIKGIRFVDYNNYKPEGASVSLSDLPQLFENGQLKLLSKIELENISVDLN